MATYNNLTSLEGLQVGDVVQYGDSQHYATVKLIDLKGYTVHAKLSGGRFHSDGDVKGGLAEADIDSSKFPSKTVYYSDGGGWSICYGTEYNKYTRIMVAGSAR